MDSSVKIRNTIRKPIMLMRHRVTEVEAIQGIEENWPRLIELGCRKLYDHDAGCERLFVDDGVILVPVDPWDWVVQTPVSLEVHDRQTVEENYEEVGEEQGTEGSPTSDAGESGGVQEQEVDA
jgi:hypothetical protein